MSEQTATWLGQQIDDHAPEATEDPTAAFKVAEACAALGGGVATAFGLTVPPDLPGRDELKAKGIAILKRWIPKLDPESVDKLKKMIQDFRLHKDGSQGDAT
jgi:hypothetical protein